MPKIVSEALKAKAWTFEAKAVKKLASRPRPGIDDYIIDYMWIAILCSCSVKLSQQSDVML